MTRRFAFFSDGKKGGLLFVHIIAILIACIFILILTRRGEVDHRLCLQKKITTDCVRKKYNLPTEIISRTEIFLLAEKKK